MPPEVVSGPPATVPPVAGSTTLPTALTTTRAPTVAPFGSLAQAEPMPPSEGLRPGALPTVAPVPAPTRPVGTGASLAALHAR